MGKITSLSELREAIQLLEKDKTLSGQLLVEQLNITYNSLKPVNLLKNAIIDISTSPNLADDILNTAVGLTTGYLSKKLFVGNSGNIIKKLLGFILQSGVSNVVSNNPETYKSIGHSLIKALKFKRK